ncbi:unnamed protein product [Phytophthora lilii]|uniref:Unnamed protein product n=1 Tax=Phytophthora lilii TaxID=2077276 RepID=A0A9W6UCT9_9STRA|nr:unnamed protein product [Phytophthora lilii]
MGFAPVFAFTTLTLPSIISASIDSAPLIPGTKLRQQTNVGPPPQAEVAPRGRQLGLFDWLFESPTAAPPPDQGRVQAYGYQTTGNDNTDDGPFSGPFWDPNASF